MNWPVKIHNMGKGKLYELGYNQAIDDMTQAIKDKELCRKPTKEELYKIITQYCMNNCEGATDALIAWLGKEKGE